ncbi:MAG: bifunctional DNA-formamidopyrimidine glycosylase/DNA-(apurinic or apyrimidinic site) lyase [Rhodospirillales bacterium]|nr:bifunctional DNA-formamidopyrimidine glycosylase/DNA-(apurinic or apyrimidinic site) lyase [Rhodospirillales bacterium]
MPELPEVETVRRGLEPVMLGRRIESVIVRRRDLRRPIPESFEDRVTGRRIEAVGRRAKYLLLDLSGGGGVIAHLGMSGRILVVHDGAPAPAKHDHVVFGIEGGATVVFNDARRFGQMDLIGPGRRDDHPLLSELGPEPLGNGFSPAFLGERLAGRSGPIKTALMDQAVVAGLGNIYACEALFRAGISPKRKAGGLGPARTARLVTAIRETLRDAIAAGGSSLRDHRQPDGELGYFQHRFAVYDREGEACPGCDCDLSKTGGVRRAVQAGRSTFYCGRRQR